MIKLQFLLKVILLMFALQKGYVLGQLYFELKIPFYDEINWIALQSFQTTMYYKSTDTSHT